MDCISIIHIPPIELYGPDYLDEIINSHRIYNPSVLRQLVTNIEVFFHIPYLGQQLFVHQLILKGIKQGCHTLGVFIIVHVGHVHPFSLQYLVNQPQRNFIVYVLSEQFTQFAMPDVVIIF